MNNKAVAALYNLVRTSLVLKSNALPVSVHRKVDSTMVERRKKNFSGDRHGYLMICRVKVEKANYRFIYLSLLRETIILNERPSAW